MGSVIVVAVKDSFPLKQRYSWARVDWRRPLPGIRRLKCPLSAGHTCISELCSGKRHYLFYSPIPSAGEGGGCKGIRHECLHVYMYKVYMYFRRHFEGKGRGRDVDVGSRTRRFHELKQKDSALAYQSSKSFYIRVKAVLYFK